MQKILVVDDDDQVRELIQDILCHYDYELTLAQNGREALKLCQKDEPDLLITDIVMPEMEGIETIIQIRKKHPRLPMIAISGGGQISSDVYLAMAKNLGASRTLSKPFTKSELLDAVSKALNE
ncbi:MAG: response regulator [Candidatus Sumerlaeia bacterium]